MDLRRLDGDRSARTGVVLSATWLVLVTVADVLLPSRVVSDSLFAIAPLIACALLPPRITAVFGVAAVLLVVASGWWKSAWETPQQWIRLVDVILVSVAAVVIAAVRVRREQRITRLAAIAETAQRVILPTIPVRVGGLATATRYLSAAEDAVVGGDLYDCTSTPRHTRFIVGDVRGKGLPAVEQAARTIRAFRQAAAIDESLDDAVDDIDAYLSPFLAEGEFVTALLVDLTSPGTITVVNCGHPPPLLIRADRSAYFLESQPGLPLGLSRLFAERGAPERKTFAWEPGDRLLLYTDGLTEARDADGAFLPLLDLAPTLQGGSVSAALDDLLSRVRAYVPRGALVDDLAVVLLEEGSRGGDTPAVQGQVRQSPAPTRGLQATSTGSSEQPASSSVGQCSTSVGGTAGFEDSPARPLRRRSGEPSVQRRCGYTASVMPNVWLGRGRPRPDRRSEA
jgi:sigma-B regulation protein RsbU (phosphoserine phosphatase)